MNKTNKSKLWFVILTQLIVFASSAIVLHVMFLAGVVLPLNPVRVMTIGMQLMTAVAALVTIASDRDWK